MATINGIKNSAKIEIKKEALNVIECVCQVFYHKLGINWWKATIAFFPKEQITVRIVAIGINSYISYFSDSE